MSATRKTRTAVRAVITTGRDSFDEPTATFMGPLDQPLNQVTIPITEGEYDYLTTALEAAAAAYREDGHYIRVLFRVEGVRVDMATDAQHIRESM